MNKNIIILYSAHDLHLNTLKNFLEIEDKSKYQYYFDDNVYIINIYIYVSECCYQSISQA